MDLFFSFIFPFLLSQKQIIGVSYFTMQAETFPCKEALSVFHRVETPATAIVWGTFGRKTECVERFLKLGKKRILEIHPWSEVWRRWPNRKGINEIQPHLRVTAFNAALERNSKKALQDIRRRLKQIDSFIKQSADENTEIILSTGLEDNYTQKAFKTVLRTTREIVGYDIARSTIFKRHHSGADYLEHHGLQFNASAPCIYSTDGTNVHTDLGRWDYSDSVSLGRAKELLRKAGKCRIAFLWQARPQGIKGESYIPIDKRVYSVSRHELRIFNAFIKGKL